MKKNSQIAIILAIVCVLIGCALAMTALSIADFDLAKLSREKQITKTYVIEEKVHSLDIDTRSADIVLVPSADDTFTVTCQHSDKMTLNVETVNGTLKITEQDQRKWHEYIGIFYYSSKVTLYVPAHWENFTFQRVHLKTTSGDISVENPSYPITDCELATSSGNIRYQTRVTSATSSIIGHPTMDTIRVKTTSGDINLSSLSGNTVRISSSSGDITVNDIDLRELSISSTSGDLEMSDAVSETLTLDSSSGDLTLHQVRTQTKIEMHTTSGDILLKNCDAATLHLTTSSGDVTCYLLTPKNFITHTGSGSIHTPPSDALAGNCEIRTSSGDIHVTLLS